MSCNGTAFSESSLIYVLGDSNLLMINLVHYHAFQDSHKRALDSQDSVVFMRCDKFIPSFAQECYPSCGYQIIGFFVQSLAGPLAEVTICWNIAKSSQG